MNELAIKVMGDDLLRWEKWYGEDSANADTAARGEPSQKRLGTFAGVFGAVVNWCGSYPGESALD